MGFVCLFVGFFLFWGGVVLSGCLGFCLVVFGGGGGFGFHLVCLVFFLTQLNKHPASLSRANADRYAHKHIYFCSAFEVQAEHRLSIR